MWPFLPAPGMKYILTVYDGAHRQLCYLPGADDDGSGSMTVLESYRALLSADFRPERAVEFHWYAAEVRQFYVPPCSYFLNFGFL